MRGRERSQRRAIAGGELCSGLGRSAGRGEWRIWRPAGLLGADGQARRLGVLRRDLRCDGKRSVVSACARWATAWRREFGFELATPALTSMICVRRWRCGQHQTSPNTPQTIHLEVATDLEEFSAVAPAMLVARVRTLSPQPPQLATRFRSASAPLKADNSEVDADAPVVVGSITDNLGPV